MAINNAYNTYKTNSINTASPEELTLMLYDGAIKFGNQALIAIEHKNYDEANRLILRTEDIIQEFRCTLDKKYPVSQTFETMYEYIYRRLVEANIKKDTEILKEAIGIIKDMRDTWKEAMKLVKANKQQTKVN